MCREYFKKTKGSFSAAIVVGLLLLDNIDMFIELFCENLLLLEDNEYVMFVKNVVDKIDELSKISKDLPDIIIESLTQSALKMQTLAKSEKIEVVDIIITTLFLKNKIPYWISKYLEDVIFL